MALAVVALIGALLYFGCSSVSTSAGASVPALPAPPARPAVRVPDPRPLPTEDDVRYVMQQIEKAKAKR